MDLEETEARYDCAGEGQQQLNRLTEHLARSTHHMGTQTQMQQLHNKTGTAFSVRSVPRDFSRMSKSSELVRRVRELVELQSE
jgi:hypothetical protein